MNAKLKDEILTNIISADVENPEEILDSISEPDEKKCLTEFFKRIIAGSEYPRSFRCVADSIIKYLGDEAWAREIYEVALSKAKNTGDLLGVAHSYMLYLHDEKRAKELSGKAAEIAKTSNDYISVADFQDDCLEDKSEMPSLYAIAERSLDESGDAYLKLGAGYLSRLNNARKGEELLRNAIDKTVEVENLCAIYEALSGLQLEDQACDDIRCDLLYDLEGRIMDEACGVDDFLAIAEYDLPFSDKALEEAELAACCVNDYLLSLEYYRATGDGAKAQEMYQKALDEADPDNPDEMEAIEKAIK